MCPGCQRESVFLLPSAAARARFEIAKGKPFVDFHGNQQACCRCSSKRCSTASLGGRWTSGSGNALIGEDGQQVAQRRPNLMRARLHAPCTVTLRQVVLGEIPGETSQIAKVDRSSATPVREVRNAAEVGPRGTRRVLPSGQMIGVREDERCEEAVAQPCR
jgi:hypothetical protein